MSGIPNTDIASAAAPQNVSILPSSFRGVKPKLMVEEGDQVKIGSPLFFDKTKPEVRWASPASGNVTSIQFGARRVIEKIEITVENNDKVSIQTLSQGEFESASRKTILDKILKANLFPLIRQRPFNKVADPKDIPRDIFISGHNSAPLSVDLSRLIKDEKDIFQTGLNVLKKLTEGNVYLTLGSSMEFDNVITQTISGPHPSGNVGIQIHHTKPLRPGDVIWSVNAQHVITLGKLFQTGSYDPTVIVSIGGSGATNPSTVKTITGVNIGLLVEEQNLKEPIRLISGDVLTGKTVENADFLGFYDSSVSIINDDVKRPFLGMLSPGSSRTKYSLTKAFLSFGNKAFNFTSSQNGELRAMVPLNAWEDVLPMDIYPNPLYRAILAQDIEEMEKLGIWECDDEDFALCSFACPSKIDVGGVVRDGLDLMEKEG
tara:strand:- start:315 stop:1607 length:1293 start_codon:yes stop_codon:yes gene_type:complete